MTTDVLDAAAITQLLPGLLPASSKNLASCHDALAALFHTAMSAVGFRLVAVDDFSPPSSATTNVLPDKWDAHGPGHYTFRYLHDQSSLSFVVKVAKLGGRTIVNAIAAESDKIACLDISTNDFVSPSFYPHHFEAADAPPLVHGFISSNRIADLMFQFKLQIIQKLIPGLRKEGYAEDNGSATSSSAAPPQAPQHGQPARPQPVAPPHAPENIPYYPPAQIIPRNPLQVGRRDLDPIIDQQNPFSPPSLFPPHGGDGMFVGPDHPMFGGGFQGAYPGGRGPWGGDGYLPPIGAPPGARFDPVTPTIGPFPGMGGAFGRGRGRGSSPGNTYNPDNDEFMPPGAGDMFS